MLDSWQAEAEPCCLRCVALQVNASVDVYAFGVMMWELFVGQRPYGNMSQQKVRGADCSCRQRGSTMGQGRRICQHAHQQQLCCQLAWVPHADNGCRAAASSRTFLIRLSVIAWPFDWLLLPAGLTWLSSLLCQVVEEVVLRGLRPCFPVGTPPGYASLAASCWHATAGARPTFQEVIARLQVGGACGCWAGHLCCHVRDRKPLT